MSVDDLCKFPSRILCLPSLVRQSSPSEVALIHRDNDRSIDQELSEQAAHLQSLLIIVWVLETVAGWIEGGILEIEVFDKDTSDGFMADWLLVWERPIHMHHQLLQRDSPQPVLLDERLDYLNPLWVLGLAIPDGSWHVILKEICLLFLTQTKERLEVLPDSILAVVDQLAWNLQPIGDAARFEVVSKGQQSDLLVIGWYVLTSLHRLQLAVEQHLQKVCWLLLESLPALDSLNRLLYELLLLLWLLSEPGACQDIDVASAQLLCGLLVICACIGQVRCQAGYQ